MVYGPSTTRLFSEDYIFHNRSDTLRPDTILHDNHHFTPVQVSSFELEDLGVDGTALRNRYFKLRNRIGAISGFEAYHHFFIDPSEINYFDTKSPYTLMEIMLGGRGRDFVNVSLNRNVNPQWNVGFDVRNMVIRRQIQSPSRRDRWHQSTQYDAHTSYRSKDGKYNLLVNFSRTNHRVTETGGTDSVVSSDGSVSFFDYNEIQALLSDAGSSELRRQYHLYHEYKFWPLAQVYHKVDRSLQWNYFNDPNPTESYYRNYYLDSTGTADRMEFNTFRNEVGIKGRYKRLFYNFYYALRSVELGYKYADSTTIVIPTNFLENYLGFNLEVPLPGDINLDFQGEYLQGGRYSIRGGIEAFGLEGHIRQQQVAVPVIYQQYLGNHDAWTTDFQDPFSTEIYGGYNLRVGNSEIKPFVQWQNLLNHVYMGVDTLPGQAEKPINILTLGADWKSNFIRNVWFKGRVKSTSVSADSINPVRIPELTVNAQLYYQNYIFKNIELQIGGEVFWQSDYFGYAYRPTIQQFYLQNSFQINAYPRTDIFLNARIGKARILFKMVNLVHWITNESYFTAPGYISHNKALDFGVRWMFFD